MSAVPNVNENTGVAILSQVMESNEASLTPDGAQALLAFRFTKKDERRMNHLAAKAQKGTLSSSERFEAEQFNLVSHVIALLQAKARHALL